MISPTHKEIHERNLARCREEEERKALSLICWSWVAWVAFVAGAYFLGQQ
jgi:hypothetical protein